MTSASRSYAILADADFGLGACTVGKMQRMEERPPGPVTK